MKGRVLLRKTVGSAHTLCYGNTDRLSREQVNGQEQEEGWARPYWDGPSCLGGCGPQAGASVTSAGKIFPPVRTKAAVPSTVRVRVWFRVLEREAARMMLMEGREDWVFTLQLLLGGWRFQQAAV